MTPPRCESCGSYVWNPEFFNCGMCGPCTTGESAELFHELWIPPLLGDVDTEEKLLAHWQRWHEDVYKPATKT